MLWVFSRRACHFHTRPIRMGTHIAQIKIKHTKPTSVRVVVCSLSPAVILSFVNHCPELFLSVIHKALKPTPMLDMKQARRSTRMYFAPDLFVRWTGILQPPIQCVMFDEGIHLSSYLGVFW